MKTKLVIIAGILAAAVTAAHAADAKANWEEHCAKCHGAAGKGDTKIGKKLNAKDYSDAAVQAKFTDEQLLEATMKGVTVDGKEKMKGYADKISEAEGKELVALIRSFKS